MSEQNLRITHMERILDDATRVMDALEKIIEEFQALQARIQELDAYYTSPQWRADFEADEAGLLPADLKRGVLSEDGIWNTLARNRELCERLGLQGPNGPDSAEAPDAPDPERAATLNLHDGLYLGADGCRGGWIACILDHGDLRMERYDSIEALVHAYPTFDAFLIDMAVGLRTSADQLRPDDLARRELWPRSSTIFPIPSRQAVYAQTEEEQKQANIKAVGKSLSKQTINIIPKIRELDEFLTKSPAYRNRILESHPEVDFSRLNGSVVMTRKKDFVGFAERAAILEKFLPGSSLAGMWDMNKTFNCNPDDLLDAACLAVTAALHAQGMSETIPTEPEQDETGLDMKLTVPAFLKR